MRPFFDHYESVMPYLVHDEPPPTTGRLEIMNEVDGAWRCRKVFNGTGACPRGIKVTRAIIESSSPS